MTKRVVVVQRFIAASPAAIFDVLADPLRHPEIDGSGTVKAPHGRTPERLSLGATFGMDMHLGMPYRVRNTVVEFEEDRLIAWRHFGRHIWRYRLAPVQGGTDVTEEFDYRKALSPLVIELMGFPKRHEPEMEHTLDRLADALTT